MFSCGIPPTSCFASYNLLITFLGMHTSVTRFSSEEGGPLLLGCGFGNVAKWPGLP